jgi:ABC-2 type transport system permease protein
MQTWIRLYGLIVKELRMVIGDKQSLRLLIMPVLLQLLLFPFAATMEVRNNTIGVYDQDGGATARELVQRISRTPAFARVMRIESEAQLRDAIDRQQALLVVRLPPHLSESVARGQPEAIQVIYDGRRSSSGGVAISYLQTVFGGIPIGQSDASATFLAVRHWYNPNLEFFRAIVPSLVAMITTLSALVVTAMSVAREREQGTLDQLLVSPLTPPMIFIGKAVPALIVAAFQAGIIITGGVFGYGIAFRGSLLVLYGGLVAYVAALIGVGLLISSVCSTQQQAFLGVFLFMMPAILLSGYVTPVDNMPSWLQTLTWANPVRHFVQIAKSVFLKASVFSDFAANVRALLLIALATTSLALAAFRRGVG